MIRVCILDSPTVPGAVLKELLDNLGFSTCIGPPIQECDAILSDSLIVDANIHVPVVVYTKQENLRHVITEAVVAERFKPLTDTVQECLDLCKAKE
jgi:hypothetical protein